MAQALCTLHHQSSWRIVYTCYLYILPLLAPATWHSSLSHLWYEFCQGHQGFPKTFLRPLCFDLSVALTLLINSSFFIYLVFLWLLWLLILRLLWCFFFWRLNIDACQSSKLPFLLTLNDSPGLCSDLYARGSDSLITSSDFSPELKGDYPTPSGTCTSTYPTLNPIFFLFSTAHLPLVFREWYPYLPGGSSQRPENHSWLLLHIPLLSVTRFCDSVSQPSFISVLFSPSR